MLAVTLAVVAVFVPVAFMEGIMGRFFYQFGVTVAVAVLISYVVSMTLTPMLSARILKEHEHHGRVSRAIEWVLAGIEARYRAALAWAALPPRPHHGRRLGGAGRPPASMATLAQVHLHPAAGHEHGQGHARAAGRHAARRDPAQPSTT